mmetsp:Transcript_8059/g.14850  ORF Transcript_8059/g.14850 Transcript_8059/m.14850 type:complete len:254 (+) Transcript_8059:153-914(+)
MGALPAALESAAMAVQPLVSPLLISDECFNTLVLQLDVLDFACLRQTLSTVAGYGVVLFACVLKLPLILNIWRTKGADGLSAVAVYIECTMYSAVLVFYTSLGSPLSTYGEKYALLGQDFIVVLLMWYYTRTSVPKMLFITLVYIAIVTGMSSLPFELKPYLIGYSSMGAIISRVPQIVTNARNGHTGVLSLGSLAAAVSGAVVRLLTILQDVKDPTAIFGEVLPLSLNSMILMQVIWYQSATKQHFAKAKKE